MKLAAVLLATRPTIECLGACVPKLHDAAVVAYDDSFCREFQELSPLAQLLFHHFEVSQIEVSSHIASNIYGAIGKRAGAEQRRHFFSVGAPKSQNPPKPTALKRPARRYLLHGLALYVIGALEGQRGVATGPRNGFPRCRLRHPAPGCVAIIAVAFGITSHLRIGRRRL